MSLIEIARRNRLKALASLDPKNIFADRGSETLSKSYRMLKRPGRPSKRVAYPIFTSTNAA